MNRVVGVLTIIDMYLYKDELSMCFGVEDVIKTMMMGSSIPNKCVMVVTILDVDISRYW